MKNGLIIHPDGSQRWYLNDELYRVDGPAIILSYGNEQWWLNNWLNNNQREDGSAVILQGWYLHGKCHRDDGPAVIFPNGNQEYYINGNKISDKK